MNLRQLEHIVKAGEGLRLEFKRKVPEWDKLMREFVALANAKGGLVLIGVDDDGSILGVKDAREVEFEVDAAVKRHCKPQPEYSLIVLPISRKRQVVIVDLKESREKPVLLVESPEDSKGIALFRVKDRSIRASRELYYILRYRQQDGNGVKFEFGEKEKQLMEFLETHDYITLNQFTQLANISRNTASRTLVMLVRANVLSIHPNEKEDKYSLADGFL